VDDGAPLPPPFDDAGDGLRTPGVAPGPPPFTSEPMSTTGSELPSFSESQAAASASGSRFIAPTPIVAPQAQASNESQELRFEGEGVAFGFKPEDQYDGLSHSMMMSPSDRSQTPPPAMASSVHDPNVTALAELITHERRLPDGDGGPPPPPALDDPLDLPPTIDEGYQPPPPSLEPDVRGPPPSAGVDGGPPPYLGAPSAPPAYLDSH